MNKDQTEQLRDDIRRTLQSLHDNLLELDDYLTRLRAQTLANVDAAIRQGIVQADELLQARDTTTDSRRPYLAGRQPRRDGNSFGTVLPASSGGTDEATKDPEQR